MKHIFLILMFDILSHLVSAQTPDYLWENWKVRYEKAYINSTEESFRRIKWEQSIREIVTHNIQHDLGLVKFTMGLNQFSDMDWEEIQTIYKPTWINPQSNVSHIRYKKISIQHNRTLGGVDWRHYGCITTVKDEKRCSASYGFSAIGCLEAQYRFNTGILKDFSTQELIDCGRDYKLYGCLGGSVAQALAYMNDKGVNFDENYRFTAKKECKRKSTDEVVKINMYEQLQLKDEVDLTNHIQSIGPLSVSIHADRTFHKYKSGIYVSNKCVKVMTNRALLAVGFGQNNNQDFYILKCSFGPNWGEDGYIRLARNKDNMCGILNRVFYVRL